MNRLNIIPYNEGVAEQRLDMFEEQSLSFNYQLSDIRDVFKQGTDYSKTIKVPSTSRNDEFFNYNFDVSITNKTMGEEVKFNPSKKILCYVDVDTEKVFDGSLQLLNIIVNNGRVEYEVVLRGNSINYISQWKNIKLRDYIGYRFDKYNHYRTPQDVAYNMFFQYIYIDGVQTQLNSTGEIKPTYGYNYYFDGQKTDDNLFAYVKDMTPALNTQEILEYIFDEIGFEIDGEVLPDDDLSNMVLLGGKKPTQSQEQLDEFICNPKPIETTLFNGSGTKYASTNLEKPSFETIPSSDDYRIKNILFRDDRDQWDETIESFVTETPGDYNINVVLPLRLIWTREFNNVNPLFISSTNGFNIEYEIYVDRADGTEKILSNDFLELKNINELIADPSNPNVIDTYDINSLANIEAFTIVEEFIDENLNTNDIVSIRIKTNFNGDIGGFISSPIPRFGNVFGFSDINMEVISMTETPSQYATQFVKVFNVTKNNTALSGDNDYIEVRNLLPDLTVYDYFNNLKQMFNLIMVPNFNTNKVVLKPRDEYFRDNFRINDEWEIDQSSDIKITPMGEVDYIKYELSYEKDKDEINNVSEETKLMGSKIVNVDTDFSNKINKLKVKLSMANTTSVIPDYSLTSMGTDGTYENVEVKPRIAYFYTKNDFITSINDLGLYLGSIDDINNGFRSYIYDYGFIPDNNNRIVGSWNHRSSSRPTGTLEFNTVNEARFYNDENTSSLVDRYSLTTAGINSYTNQSPGLYSKYYKDTLDSIQNVDAKLMTCMVKLTPRQIKEFDFRDVFFINNVYWRVNKIMDYNPLDSDKLTKVEFVRVFNIESANTFIPNVTSDTIDVNDWLVGGAIWNRYYIKRDGTYPNEYECSVVNGRYKQGFCYVNSRFQISPFTPTNNPIPRRPRLNKNYYNTVLGRGNRLTNYKSNMLVVGNNNYASGDVGGSVIVLGDNIRVTDKTPTLYIGNVKINENGEVHNVKPYIIDGGEDIAFNYDKTNLIDIVDGTIDSVRNSGGDSKLRPIISNNKDDVNNTYLF